MKSVFLSLIVIYSWLVNNVQASTFTDSFSKHIIYFSDLSKELASSLNKLGDYQVIYIQSGKVLAGDGLINNSLPSCALAKKVVGFVNSGDRFVVSGAKDYEGVFEVRVDFALEKAIGVSCWPKAGPFVYVTKEDVLSTFGTLFKISFE